MDTSATPSEDRSPTPPRPPSPHVAGSSSWAKAGLFVFTLAGGLSIFMFGSPYFDTFPTNGNVAFSVALIAIFGLISLVVERRPHLTSHASCSYALFVAATANLMLTLRTVQLVDHVL